MKFRDVRQENKNSIELICLLLSLGAIFIQIWILTSSWEAYFEGDNHRLIPAIVLSFCAFLACALSAWTTGMSFMKKMDDERK